MTLKIEQQKFNAVAKRILKKNLSTNPETLNSYQVNIVTAYNNFIDYVTKEVVNLRKQDEDLKDVFLSSSTQVKQKLIKCFKKLNLLYAFTGSPFERVIDTKLVPFRNNDPLTDEDSSDNQENNDDNDDNDSNGNNSANDDNNDNNDDDMALPTEIEFVNAYSKVIPSFDGTFGKLRSCIDALSIIRDAAGTHEAVAVNLIKSKFTDDGRDCLLDTDDTVQKIIDRLKGSIKGETSESVIAKMQNIKQKDKPTSKFVKEIQDLAISLKSVFISEGVPHNLADKFVVQQSVLAMKHNASLDKVKLVMEAGKFDTLNEAIAKFISTSNETASHDSVMFMSQNKFNRFGRHNNYNNGPQRGQRNYSNYRGNNSRGYYNNNNNQNGRNSRDNNYQNGNFRGNYRGNNYKYNRGYYNGNFNGNNQGRDRVRFINESGNETNPQFITLGDVSNQRSQQK